MSEPQNRKQPNLIFVMADQLRYQSVGFASDEKARTPNIDKLASEGIVFTNAVSNTPVCAAYRASLLTGKYTTTTGMVINELRMNPNHECIGHIVTRNGYNTGYIGKWHLYANELGNHMDPKNSYVPPGPYRLGFDGYWAAYNFHHTYYNAYYHTNSPEKISYGEGVYEPDGQTDLAIGFIESAIADEKPFVMVLSYGTPHDPWVASNVPEEYIRVFDGVEFPNPPNYREENDPYADGWGRFKEGEREKLPSWRRYYYAMTSNLDWNVGRLIAAIDSFGIKENTIFVFTSDHGEMFGAHGRRAKNIFYEEACRVPLVIRWPGKIEAGIKSDVCISTVDIMPTLLSMMDLPIPDEVEGMDLSHCALGGTGDEPEAALLQNTGACAAWENGHEWRALRSKRYTYAKYRVDGKELLFDNQNDPYQLINLVDDPDSREVLEHLREMLKVRMAEINDTFEECTWYRDHWTKDRIILRGARG